MRIAYYFLSRTGAPYEVIKGVLKVKLRGIAEKNVILTIDMN